MDRPPKADQTPRMLCQGGPFDGDTITGGIGPNDLTDGLYVRREERGGAVWVWIGHKE